MARFKSFGEEALPLLLASVLPPLALTRRSGFELQQNAGYAGHRRYPAAVIAPFNAVVAYHQRFDALSASRP